MPLGLASAPDVDLDRLDQGAASLPVSQDARAQADFGQAFHGFDKAVHAVRDAFVEDAEIPQPQISAEDANARYGVPGTLRFNAPLAEDDAAWQSAQAHEQLFRSSVLARSRPQPLTDFAAGLAGSLVNPVNLGLMAATGGMGEGASVALGLRGGAEAAETAATVSGLGRLANPGWWGRTFADGVVTNAPYVAAAGGLTALQGDDYDMGDALRDLAAGAIFHTGAHVLGLGLKAPRAAPGEPGAALEPGPAQESPQAFTPASGVPEAVRDLPPATASGAFVKAIDDMADDRPVDVGQYVDREVNPPDIGRLDESTADPAIASFRPLDLDTAVTPRGTDVPVRYGLAELGDLSTSHDDNLQPNPAYPPELQPRDRARAGAQARNYQLEAELNPKLLMQETSAAAGAPIVSPEGVVESGNGRTIALRRSATAGGDAYARYLAELNARGFDTSGMSQPVLVRMRTQAMGGAARAALAREMNADVTERMSPVEQAMSDSRRIDDALNQVGEGGSLRDRDFVRGFIDRVAPDQVAAFTDREGRLSPEGERRIRAAVLARAYGDPRLVGQVFEGEESPARLLGEALADAAPAWARMRALAASGEIPRELDLTPALSSAMDLVRLAREQNISLGELVAERLGQTDMFSGEAIGPGTEALLRMFHRDEAMKRPLAKDKISAALKDYARQAMAVTPGPDLFGETAGESTSRQILKNLAEQFGRNDAGDIDVRPPGRAADSASGPDAGAARAPVLDLRPDGEGRAERGDGGLSEGGEPGAEGEGDRGAGRRPRAEQLIAADPDLKALQASTEALEAEHGLEPPAEGPSLDNVADALRAAAICLAG